ncbi:hypothetical protein GR11A_00098 [Vibrio phage vB_VcorM_GR11A]|nr:hypothetical protein GR11A_00098 [Vibrio phage vB_VcorM_GR11A]
MTKDNAIPADVNELRQSDLAHCEKLMRDLAQRALEDGKCSSSIGKGLVCVGDAVRNQGARFSQFRSLCDAGSTAMWLLKEYPMVSDAIVLSMKLDALTQAELHYESEGWVSPLTDD